MFQACYEAKRITFPVHNEKECFQYNCNENDEMLKNHDLFNVKVTGGPWSTINRTISEVPRKLNNMGLLGVAVY